MERSGLLFLLLASTGCVSARTHALIDETYARTRAPDTGDHPPRTRHAAEPPDETTLRAPIRRETVVSMALARDPTLGAHAHHARAAVHGARAEGSLPSPEVNVQLWNLPLVRPYALGEADMYMAEIRQSVPAPGALDARARAALEEAHGMLADVAERERALSRRVSEAYADYAGATLRAIVRRDERMLLEQLAATVMARYSGGGSALSEIPRIELEQARNARAMARAEGDLRRARATLNTLLHRSADAPLGPPADLGPLHVTESLEALDADAIRLRSELRRAQSRSRAARARTDAARAEATWPSFMFALSYWQMPSERPGIGGMAGMSLPWIWAGPRERLRQAETLEHAEEHAVEGLVLDVRSAVTAAHARARTLEAEFLALRGPLRTASARALEAARAGYVSGGALLPWLDAVRGVLDARLEEADTVAEIHRAIAELEEVVGRTVRTGALTGQAAGDVRTEGR